MVFIKFRIDTQWVKDGRTVKGWFVLGQRSTDYNWSLLHECRSYNDAKNFVRRKNGQTVYIPGGYEIKL